MRPPLFKTRRLSLAEGAVIELTGTIIGFVLLLIPLQASGELFRLFVFLISFGLLIFFPHCLAHYIVGEAVGLKFSNYVFATSTLRDVNSPVIQSLDSLLPRLGIRLTAQSRKSATRSQRIFMFSAGFLASTFLTLAPTIIAYTTLSSPMFALLPLLWVAYLLFGVYFSPKYGDLSHIRMTPH